MASTNLELFEKAVGLADLNSDILTNHVMPREQRLKLALLQAEIAKAHAIKELADAVRSLSGGSDLSS